MPVTLWGNNILAESNVSGDDGGAGDDADSNLEDFIDLHEIDWIIVFAYFDETGMHASAPDTVVAGYLFSRDSAKAFKQGCADNVFPLLPFNKRGKKVFHASKCCPDFGNAEYESLPLEKRRHIADLVADETVKTVSLGCVVGMEKEEYRKAVEHSPILRQLSGSEYTACLVRCVENMASWLDGEKISGRVLYVFEAGCEHEDEATRFLNNIAKSEELKRRYRWHNYAFVEKSPQVPHLFSADLLAWEWQRWRLNGLNPQMKEGRPILRKLITGKPHIKEYISEPGLGIRALINSFYGVSTSKQPIEIKNQFFHLKDFPE
jgi:hypothetical protein